MAIIVDIIQDKNPGPVSFIAEPFMHKSKYVGTGALATWYPDPIGEPLKSLFNPCCITSMNPKYPCLRRGVT
jgi:hypothetical protein